ncbi:hypothetical protein FOE78_05905 [Microlunatus elymi]|uniref:PNPLA domain-containing protein n=1 Tax=Microlunatus elymi TaxID=2596828 RepID=A0A516PWG2_9ACTN|nr:patatin-like phospholipase family protein [Microlunatus elymi]QDP95500.1 hypothetical protein FOE78_05905 [Microlunatus elymi]
MRLTDIAGKIRSRFRRRVTGLVLSGGGSRADFELGALRYLYDEVGINPQIMVGTSAGSILASILAQTSDAAGQRRLLTELTDVWRAMRSSNEMFTANAWFDILSQRGLEWMSLQKQEPGAIGRTLQRVSRRSPDPRDPDSGTSGGRSLGMVEVLSTLREVSRVRPQLSSLIQSMTKERSLYRIGPIMDRLIDGGIFVSSRIPDSGVQLRIATVSLETGELRYVTEQGSMVDRQNNPFPSGVGQDRPIDLADAIMASCAIPAVFEPVRLGGETYVDGGVRENLPTRIATKRLGVTTCYAIVANPLGVPVETSYQNADLLSVAIRATGDIMTDEELRDEVAGAHRDGAILIQPELNLHDVLTVDPGLTAISIDYGYARAAEAVRKAPAGQSDLVRELFELRRDIWELERTLFVTPADVPALDPDATEAHALRWVIAAQQATQRPVVDPERAPELTELIKLKQRLRDLVARVDADLLPPEAPDWWKDFEPHNFDVPIPAEWS